MSAVEVLHVLNGSAPNGLPSKAIFDNVASIEKKKPETTISGVKNRDSVDESASLDLDKPNIAEATNFYKRSGGNVQDRFIKFLPGREAEWLQENHPNAFLLLCQIARRARRYEGDPDGLAIGMARIGDFKNAGIESERKYRTAKEVLSRVGAIKICETARNRKKSTTGATTVGTLVILLKSDIWDINPQMSDDRRDDRPTTDRRPTDDEQEELVSKLSSISHTTMSPSQAQSTKVSERIFFDWGEMKLKGIEESDMQNWKAAFPNVDIPEYLKFIEVDIGAKPTKYKKRKQILRTVIIYFQNRNENLKAKKNNPGFQQQKPESHHNKSFNKDTRPAPTGMRLDFSGEKKQ